MERIKKVVFSDFLGTLTMGAFTTYAYWYLYYYTRSQSIVASLGALTMATALLSFIGGYIADQYSKIKALRVIVTLRLLIVVGGLLLFLAFSSNKIIYLIVILNALIGIVYVPLAEAVPPVLVANKKDLFTVNSWVSAAKQIATVGSSAISVVMVILKKPVSAFIIVAFSLSLSLILIYHLQADAAPVNRLKMHVNGLFHDFMSGLKLVVQNRLISFMIPVALVTNFCFWSIWLLMPKYSIDLFGKFKIVYNVIDVSFTVGGIIGALAFSKQHKYWNSARIYPYLLAGQAITLILLGVNALLPHEFVNVIYIATIWISYGVLNSISSVIYFSIIQISAKSKNIGLIVGSVLTIFSIANPVAALMSAPLVQIASVSEIIIALGTIMLLASIPVFSSSFRKELNKYGHLEI